MPRTPKRPSKDGAVGRKRGGRPPNSYAETEIIRAKLKTAASEAFASRGWYGMSVDAIVQIAGVSRPTFYRYFSSVDEVMHLIFEELNDRLMHDLTKGIDAAQDPIAKVEAGILALRAWGEWAGPMLKSIYAEVHDPRSPAHRYRQEMIDWMIDEIGKNLLLAKYPLPPRIHIETLVIAIEHLAYGYHLNPEATNEASWSDIRHAMLQLAVGLLVTPASK